jgi:hypothetical protein
LPDGWKTNSQVKIVVGVRVGLPENEINPEINRNFTGGKTAAPIAAGFIRKSKSVNTDLFAKKTIDN